jgi:hypothetical protein
VALDGRMSMEADASTAVAAAQVAAARTTAWIGVRITHLSFVALDFISCVYVRRCWDYGLRLAPRYVRRSSHPVSATPLCAAGALKPRIVSYFAGRSWPSASANTFAESRS